MLRDAVPWLTAELKPFTETEIVQPPLKEQVTGVVSRVALIEALYTI